MTTRPTPDELTQIHASHLPCLHDCDAKILLAEIAALQEERAKDQEYIDRLNDVDVDQELVDLRIENPRLKKELEEAKASDCKNCGRPAFRKLRVYEP